jgi:tripartite-type tricarboxylate transporter receptor subunit TctC
VKSALPIIATLAFALPAGAQTPAEFYKGRTVSIVVGFGPGGGYDLYARVLGRFIGEHIPGRPSVVVQNMDGAGSVRASNYIYSNAPKDGTNIAAVNQNMPMYALLGGRAAQFDAGKMVWIGSMGGSNGILYTWHTSPVKSIDDAKRTVTTLGGTGTNSDSHIFPTLINNLIGTRFKVINGYPGGSKDIHLAIERGEVEGRGGNSWSSLTSSNRDWIDQKKLNMIVQIGFEREKELPNTPLLQELVKTDREKQIVDLVSLPTVLGYAHWVAPEVPADRVAALRAAYDETMRDPAFLAEVKKLSVTIKPATGAEIEALVRRVANTPKPIIDEAARLLEWKD